MAQSNTIQSIVQSFAHQLVSHIESEVAERVRSVLGAGAPRRRGRPPGSKNKVKGAGVASVGRPRRALSPKTAATRRLQGQYLGALNGLKGAARARVKKTVKTDGVAAALKLALALKKK